jgi:hypothetical protein
MANLEPPGHDLITLHVYSPPPDSNWRCYNLAATTLADYDRLIQDRPETVAVDFGRTVPGGQAPHLDRKVIQPAWVEKSISGITTGPIVSTPIAAQRDLHTIDHAAIHYYI